MRIPRLLAKKSIVLPAVVTAALLTVYPVIQNVASAARDTYESLETFTSVIATVRKHYVDEVETDALIEGALKGMISSLDPHSAYLTRDMFKELQIDTRGEFGGLGIEITLREEILTIVTPIEGTPAFRAGVKPGDQIIRIDGEYTKDMTLQEAVDKMRGQPGTDVTLSVHREKVAKLIEVPITREIIHIESVKRGRLIDGRFAYVFLVQFQQDSAKELVEALDEIEADAPDGIDGLILDLRFNPGGLLDQAVAVSDLFLDAGMIVSTNGRMVTQKDKWLAHAPGTRALIPMVLLVNGGSASASEIVAGALQDHERAVVVGTRTFGKASVQTILRLPDDAALRLTTARYYTPGGRSIHETGIQPDVIAEIPGHGEGAAAETDEADEPDDEIPVDDGEAGDGDSSADEDEAAAGEDPDAAEDTDSGTAEAESDTAADEDDAAADEDDAAVGEGDAAADEDEQDADDDDFDITKDPQLVRAVELLRGWEGDIELIGGVAGFKLASHDTALADGAEPAAPADDDRGTAEAAPAEGD